MKECCCFCEQLYIAWLVVSVLKKMENEVLLGSRVLSVFGYDCYCVRITNSLWCACSYSRRFADPSRRWSSWCRLFLVWLPIPLPTWDSMLRKHCRRLAHSLTTSKHVTWYVSLPWGIEKLCVALLVSDQNASPANSLLCDLVNTVWRFRLGSDFEKFEPSIK